jgi:hypothetical protein
MRWLNGRRSVKKKSHVLLDPLAAGISAGCLWASGCLPSFPGGSVDDGGASSDGTVADHGADGATRDASFDGMFSATDASLEAASPGADGSDVDDEKGTGSDASGLSDVDNDGSSVAADGSDGRGDGSEADAAAKPYPLANVSLTGLIFTDGTAVYGTVGGFAVAIGTGTGAVLATGTSPIGALLAHGASNLYALGTAPNLPQGASGQDLLIVPKPTLQGSTIFLSA